MSLVPKVDVDIALATELVRGRLCADSAAHCERTSDTARALASRHGVDADAAALAGLLHDWSRDESEAELLTFAETAGLAVLPEERSHPYLLHARVGAEQVRRAFPGIPLDVLCAIASHTVGTVPMTPLDKVVYIADMVEPARRYPAVEDIREAAGSLPLDDAFRVAYAQSIHYVLESGKPLHPLTRLVMAQIDPPADHALATGPGTSG